MHPYNFIEFHIILLKQSFIEMNASHRELWNFLSVGNLRTRALQTLSSTWVSIRVERKPTLLHSNELFSISNITSYMFGIDRLTSTYKQNNISF